MERYAVDLEVDVMANLLPEERECILVTVPNV